MFKKWFVAAAIVLASPAFASAQDIFWSFSRTELITTTVFDGGLTGSAYIFSDGLFGFDIIDLELTTSDSDVVRFTGGEAFNPAYPVFGSPKFDSTEITIDAEGSSGRLLSVNVSEVGVDPNLLAMFDPDYEAGVGPNGAVLLARVDFELVGVGGGDVNLEFALGPVGASQLDGTILNPSFGSATLFAAVPICVGPDPDNLGDLDYSGSVDFSDIPPFIAVLVSGDYVFRADCNADEVVDFSDIPRFIEILTNG